ncbi:hypothetical protein, partial [Streptomyces sp. SM14]|uniref:hypothetical protein n=1 Tax=Streptomyces sp. SM14 TaxID=1736045 RepID=UPI001CA498FE
MLLVGALLTLGAGISLLPSRSTHRTRRRLTSLADPAAGREARPAPRSRPSTLRRAFAGRPRAGTEDARLPPQRRETHPGTGPP